MEIVNKVYEAETLFQSVTSRAKQYKELKGQLEKLKQEFAEIVNNDQFLGKGAEAIKGFYGAQIDVVDAWIRFINMNIAFFEGIEGTAEEKTLSGETVVKMPFLEEDLAQSNKRAYEMVSQQKDDLQDIFDDINDLISLTVFSSEKFETSMDKAEDERTKTIEKVNELDGDLTTEYAVSEQAEIYVFALYAQLLEATKQGEKISPLYFNEKAYQTSEVYQLKDDMEKQGDAYLTFKKEQKEAREVQKEIEAQANKPWHEKAWDATKTFTGEITGYYDYKRATEGVDPVTGRKLSEAERIVAGAMAAAGFIPVVGWVGRAAKGGKAIYSTAKGYNAASHALDAYKTSKSMSILEKSEMGIYGLVAANGMTEAVTGKDMFGNELTEEQRQNSLLTALGIGGVAGAAKYVDSLGTKNVKEKMTSIEKVHTQFSADQLKNSQGFEGKFDDVLKNVEMTPSKFNKLKLKPHDELTDIEIEKLKAIREAVAPITRDTILQKTIPFTDIEKYLDGTGNYAKVGGYIAKAEDVHHIKEYDDFVESLRLDYTDWNGNRPFPDGGGAYGVIKFKTDDSEKIFVPYGKKFGGENTDGPPCTLNGFTGSRNGSIIPEFKFEERIFPVDGAELYKVTNGKEVLVGVFDEKLERFVRVDI